MVVALLPELVISQGVTKSDRARSIVKAVNQKDAEVYVDNFSEDVKVFMYGENGNFELRVDGKKPSIKTGRNILKDIRRFETKYSIWPKLITGLSCMTRFGLPQIERKAVRSWRFSHSMKPARSPESM